MLLNERSHGFGAVVGVSVGEGLNLCLLANGRIETARLTREADVIQRVVRERPNLVSLSAPGTVDARVLQTAPNPPRETTKSLAKAIRSQGFGVIGAELAAAESILGTRRNAILSQLGARNAISPADLPRERHDAVSAALVGWLFWSGSFEVIEATEDFRIVVPSNDVALDKWSDRIAIGLSGLTGSGKTTAGKHLQRRGFHYTRYSLVIQEIARESGREPSRSTLQELGREIHETRGQYWLGDRLLRDLPKSGCIVIDGLRYPEDHAFLTSSFGPCFGHLAIVTPTETRRRQFMESRPSEDFERARNHKSESKVEMVGRLAHMVVTNDRSLEEFLAEIDAVIAEFLSDTGRVWKCYTH